MQVGKNKHIVIYVLFLCSIIVAVYHYNKNMFIAPIKVGVLHSLTGTMAISETAVVKATKMAIQELNEKGGLLGRPIEVVLVDGKSDWDVFAQGAENLIVNEKVSVVFGCWTSSSRKMVKPIFEKYNNLLFYPVQYEGIESSKNIVYTGASPNQQIIPGIFWAFHHLGKKFFLVGSDYIFPRMANEIIKDYVSSLGGEVVGEAYIPLGGKDVAEAVQKIVDSKPDVIINTINGDTNVLFFKSLRQHNIVSNTTPTISFSIAEKELESLNLSDMIGDYTVWNYYQSINSTENSNFIINFKKHNPEEKRISDPMEAAYFGVHLWAQAVESGESVDPQSVLEHISDQSYLAPGGVVYVDPDNQHTWKYVRIGKIRFDGQFNIVWRTKKQIRPEPYIHSRSKKSWEKQLLEYYTGWGNKWGK